MAEEGDDPASFLEPQIKWMNNLMEGVMLNMLFSFGVGLGIFIVVVAVTYGMVWVIRRYHDTDFLLQLWAALALFGLYLAGDFARFVWGW